MLIIGTIIAAGFCSGKEIETYFASYGFFSLFFIPLLFVLYYYIFKLFLSFGKKERFQNIYDLNKKIFVRGAKCSNVLLFFIYLIFTSAMFAGIREIGQNFSNFTSIIFLLLAFVIAFVVLLKPFDVLKKINSIFIPFLAAIMMILCVVAMFSFSKGNLAFQVEHGYLMFFNPVIYACQGLAVAYFILVKAGENLTDKQIKLSAFLSSFLLCSMQILVIVVLNFMPELANNPMPLLTLAFKTYFPLGIVYLFVLFVAILTTLFATSRSLAEITNTKIKNARLSAFLSLLFAFILSFFGFDKIIEYLYPVIGLIGFCILMLLIYRLFFVNRFQFENAKIHDTRKDT